MKRTIQLGDGLTLNIDKLVETRLLAQANSGGGKSMLLRKLLEESHGMVQQIVLDMEGEFSTLREKHDFILAGKGGDIPTDPRSAALLARKVLELGTSLIVDLYDLRPHDQALFVKNFLDSLMSAPKDLWHPVLVVIDEAHKFVPEKGKGESAASEAVTNLATRGRKRGFAAVLATQRLSKLNKDVAAELLNKLIGRTGLDQDMKRASEELGFASKADMLQLRSLSPGEFFAFGPAISEAVVRGKVGKVKTTHPQAGQRAEHKVPLPTAKVKGILAKLTDLPKAAEEEARDVATLKARVRALEGELRQAGRGKPSAETEKELLSRGEALGRKAAAAETKEWISLVDRMRKRLGVIAGAAQDLLDLNVPGKPSPTASYLDPIPSSGWVKESVTTLTPGPRPRSNGHRESNGHAVDPKGLEGLGRCAREILKFLAMQPGKTFTKVQLGVVTKYAHSSGNFSNALSELARGGFITRPGGDVQLAVGITEDLIEMFGEEYAGTSREGLEAWLSKLSKVARSIYEVLLRDPGPHPKENLGELTGYAWDSGNFSNGISELCTLGLADRAPEGIRLNPEILNL